MKNKKFAIIGLGYFGINLAVTLAEKGAEVIAIDNVAARVELVADKITLAMTMDATDKAAVTSLGLEEVDAVIVAIGENFEASLTTTAILQEIGVKKIFNRVISPIHERLLKLMNVDELLVPEADAATNLANRLNIDGLLEAYEIDSDHNIFEIKIPEQFIGKTIAETEMRQKYNLNLITVKRIIVSKGLLTLGQKQSVKVTGVPSPDFVLSAGDILVLFGKESDVKMLLDVD